MLYSKKLSEFPEIKHGFTTRKDGNFKDWLFKNQDIFKNYVLVEQVHKTKITYVNQKSNGEKIKGSDGLITKTENLFLGIRTADCLPLLFYESKEKIIGAVHAGWRGTLLGISQKMVVKIKELGGEIGNILVIFGPSIQKCCYDIDENRALIFKEKFGENTKVVSLINGKFYLDLVMANFLQLLKIGIKKENIEKLSYCTSCTSDLFFSYRRTQLKKDTYGEMLSFIGMNIPC